MPFLLLQLQPDAGTCERLSRRQQSISTTEQQIFGGNDRQITFNNQNKVYSQSSIAVIHIKVNKTEDKKSEKSNL